MSVSTNLKVKTTEPSELVEKLSSFYCDLLPNLYNLTCPKFLNDVKCALKDIRRLKFKMNEQHNVKFYIDVKYNKPSVRCAYMYAYNILNSAVVYIEFSKYLKASKAISNLFTKEPLKICCLAGGPATEAVAISKAITDFINEFSKEVDLFTDIEVTVVDNVAEWQTEGKTLINALNQSQNVLSSKGVYFHYNILKADLFSPFEKCLKDKLAEATIISIVNFGSSIEEKSAPVCVSYLQNMIENIIDCMGNSCLFMLDRAGSKIFQHTLSVVSKLPNRGSYERSLHKKYRLTPKTLHKMEACINFRNVTKASTLFPTVFTTISSCYWIKRQRRIKKKRCKTLDVKNDTTTECVNECVENNKDINIKNEENKKQRKKKEKKSV